MAQSSSPPTMPPSLEAADRFFEAQEYGKAKLIYETLIHERASPAKVWQRLSVIALIEGHLNHALDYALEAHKRDPKDSTTILNLAELNRRLGKLADALHWAQFAITHFSHDPVAHYNLASVHLDLQDDLKAQEALIEATRLQPNHSLAWNNLGSVYQRRSLFEEAYEAYAMAVQINPSHAEAQCNKGSILYQRKQLEAARACTELALQARPNFLEAKNNLKHMIDPQGGAPYLMALAGLASGFQNQQRHLAVIELLQSEVQTGGALAEMAQLWHLLGISYYKLNQFASAYQCYQEAIAIAPRFPGALNSLGFLLQDMRLYEDAKLAFEDALRLEPSSDMARLNLGLLQLKLGEWEAGWDNYESRWTGSAEAINQTQVKPNLALPVWDGAQGAEHKRILVLAEQGFGDAIQFCRYLQVLQTRAQHISFHVPDALRRLMEWSFPNVDIRSLIPARLDPWSAYIPLLSLPRIFQTRLETIPAATPYLQVPTIFKEFWQRRVQQTRSDRLKIGIAWSGRKTLQYDARRSIPFDALAPLLAMDHIDWICLQKWDRDVDERRLDSTNWLDWTAELQDFADTAALIENLDAVVAVDSAVAHLAGALHKPVYLLNRYDGEWRWLCNQSRSPWYPSMQIVNQTEFGNWTSVIEAVKQKIQGLTLDRSMGS
ncbi:tetratricopeptide repeat protein [Polynucleobacter sp. HIN7]|uniref:tetratricopeptide repeat protein n=1 Tax=Polynucleobacter sp. HIN7 TaxID=3047866 RepID=UPI0025733545|nr:tetratricopeptide repeat protein [Polynucleobacter sp. HIN7]